MAELLNTELMKTKKFTLEDELRDQEDFINYQFAENDSELGFVTDDGPVFTAEIKKDSIRGLRQGVQKFKAEWNPRHNFKEDQPIYCYRGGTIYRCEDLVQKEIEKQISGNRIAQKQWDDLYDVFSDTISRVLSREYGVLLNKKIP